MTVILYGYETWYLKGEHTIVRVFENKMPRILFGNIEKLME